MRTSIGVRVVFAVGLLGLAVALPRAETRTSNAMNAKEKANLQHVRNWWLECLEGRNLDATAKYQADSYIQHNINFPTGRAGFVKIFGERPAPDEVFLHHDETADAISAAGGLAIEVSTAGLRKPVGELYPDRGLLEACHARGIPVTTASDAHLPEDVGRDLDQAVELMRSAGYETVTVFDGRKARQEPVG